MVGERSHLQVQVQLQVQGREFETRFLHVAMKDVEMEIGGCSGQFDCRMEEERSEMEWRDRSKMEEPELMEGTEPMEDKSYGALGTEVEGPFPA